MGRQFLRPKPATIGFLLEKNGARCRRSIEKLYAGFKNKCALPAEVMADAWYRGSVKMLADSAGKAAPSYAYYFDYLTPKSAPHIRGRPIRSR